MRDFELLPPNERKLEEEWRAQHAEGRRRLRDYEKISTTITLLKGAGDVVLPVIEGVNRHTMDDKPPELYIESPADFKALQRELADLDRDLRNLLLSETVIHHETE